MAACEFNDLRHFGFCDIIGEYSADPDTMTVHVEHDFDRRFAAFVKNALEDVHDKLHRGVVVVQDEHLVETRLLGLRARFRDDADAGTVPVAAIRSLSAIVALVSHEPARVPCIIRG